MISATDFRLCISSFEFSLVFNACRNCCPSCGSAVDGTSYSEVRISSLLILVGFGSFLWYRLTFGKKHRSSNLLSQESAVSRVLAPVRQQQQQQEEAQSSPGDWRQRIANWSSTPADRKGSLPESVTSLREEDSTFLRSFSISSNNESIFGDQTVAKLDVLLNQIQDIKKSVGQMDAELLTVRKTGKLLRVTVVDDSSDANETSPPSPTLEWDSNDINDIALYNDDPLSEEQEESSSSLSHRIPTANSDSSDSRLHLDLKLDRASERASPPSPSSSSGKGSLVSSPGEKSAKEKRVQDILSEARRLGVVNDLLDALLEAAKRDSAFFET